MHADLPVSNMTNGNINRNGKNQGQAIFLIKASLAPNPLMKCLYCLACVYISGLLRDWVWHPWKSATPILQDVKMGSILNQTS